MKKVLAIILAVVAVVSAASVSYSGFDNRSKPANVTSVQLGTCNYTSATDTLAASAANCYGPYNLSVDATKPQFQYLRAYCNVGAIASGDSLQFGYQVLPGMSLADTSNVWTAADTLIAGKQGSSVTIGAYPGQSIVFRLLNIDYTSVEIGKPIRVEMSAPMYQVKW